MHTTAATVSAVSMRRRSALAEDEEDQAGQQQRGDGHAGDRVRRRADLAGQPRRDGDEQEAEQQDHHRAEDALKAQAQPELRHGRQDERPGRGCRRGRRSSTCRARCDARRSPPPPRGWRAGRAGRRDDRAEDQRQRPAHADDAARRHRPGADVAQVVAVDLPGSMFGSGPVVLPLVLGSTSRRRVGRMRPAIGRAFSPNVAISGPRTKYDSTAPAIIRQAMRGPIR